MTGTADLWFRHDLAGHALAVKTAHDGAMSLACELVGDDPDKRRVLAAYDRGVYTALVAQMAAVGMVPMLAPGQTAEQIARQTAALAAGESVLLAEVVTGFVEAGSLQ